MPAENYFLVNRRIAHSLLWLEEPFTRGQAWLDLIMLANHTAGSVFARGVRVPVGRGQVAWSVVRLAARWQWSRGKVERFLNRLETEQRIDRVENSVTSLFTIINYDKYQGARAGDDTQDEPAADRPPSTKRGSKQSTKKEVKELKKLKEEKKPYGEAGACHLTDTEMERLIEKFGQDQALNYIERVGDYIASTGRRYASHYHTILNWHRRDVAEGKAGQGPAARPSRMETDLDTLDAWARGDNGPGMDRANGGQHAQNPDGIALTRGPDGGFR